MASHRAYIGVGSNIAPMDNIPEALARLAACTHIVAVSTFFRTQPIGPDDSALPKSPGFLNGVVQIATDLTPHALKEEVLRPIEVKMGRVRLGDRYAPRPIDLDILLYDSDIIAQSGLTIPDPDIRRRPFLAAALLELAPTLVMPDTGERLADSVEMGEGALLDPASEFTHLLKERLGL